MTLIMCGFLWPLLGIHILIYSVIICNFSLTNTGVTPKLGLLHKKFRSFTNFGP
jgi:hypothetical protein